MMRIAAPSCNVDIFIAGDVETARAALRGYCMRGLCVSLTPADFIYTGGLEAGVRVGFINYPRFPQSPEAIMATAIDCGEYLIAQLDQLSCCVVGPTETVWLSRRAEFGQ